MIAMLDDVTPDQGLPILELFHRKAPQALDMPGGERGEPEVLRSEFWGTEQANEHALDDTGLRPIHIAALNGHVRCLEFLLGRGIDPNTRINRRRTALHVAAIEGHVGCVKALLDAGANLGAEDVKVRELPCAGLALS